ncbi:MAG: GatB/YqeY domain-containing protein [Gemmatimonadota bacterium]
MPEIAARLRADQVSARKASDKDRTLVLGTVLSSFKNREIELGREPTDDEIADILRKQIKQRLDSVEQFTAAARLDLVAKEEYEIGVLRGYLPPEADPEEIRAAAREAIAAGATDIGKVMAALMGRFKGKADGKVINQIAREALQQG